MATNTMYRAMYRAIRPKVTADEWRFAGAEELLSRRNEWDYERDELGKCKAVLMPSRSQPNVKRRVQKICGHVVCDCPDYKFPPHCCAHAIALALALGEVAGTKEA